MNKIEQIKQAIAQADAMQSKLAGDVLDVPSFTSLKIRHLLNNLGAISTNYLECGTHKGGHFCSVVYRNSLGKAIAFDDYSEFYVNGQTREECIENLFKHTPEETYWRLVSDDCFRSDYIQICHPEVKFDLYNYDAQHTESSQQRAVTHFVDNLASEVIMVVDDWAFNGVESGTRTGIKLAGLEVLFEQVMLTPKDGLPNDHWHNGFAIFLLKKQIL